jgi:hypothetical protein
MANLISGVDELGARARGERRYTQAQVVSVNSLDHTAVLDVGATAPSGVTRYLGDVNFTPQSPPNAGDHVSLVYGSLAPQSAVIAGSQLGDTNTQGSLQVDGATVIVEVGGAGPVGPRQTLNLIAGSGVSSIVAADNPADNRIDITLNVSGGGGGGGSHALLDGSVDSDTVAHTVVAGDLVYGNATPKWAGLGTSGRSAGDVLTLAGSPLLPTWATPSGGSGGWTAQAVSGATTLTGTGPTVAMCDNSGSAYTVSIPSGAGYAGNLFVIERNVINSNHITVQVLSGGTINGSNTLVLGAYLSAYGQQFESVILESNGTEYKIVGAVQAYSNVVRPTTALLISAGIGTFSWVVPSGVTEIDSPNQRTQFDLSSCSQARIVVATPSASAYYSATLAVEYSTNGGISWSYLDGSSGPNVTVGASGVQASAWVNLTGAAIADVQLRVVGSGGDGTHAQDFGQITVQVK